MALKAAPPGGSRKAACSRDRRKNPTVPRRQPAHLTAASRCCRFSSVWQDTLSVLVARGRARVSVSASVADWPKRIRDMKYVDHDDFAAAH